MKENDVATAVGRRLTATLSPHLLYFGLIRSVCVRMKCLKFKKKLVAYVLYVQYVHMYRYDHL